MIWLVYERETGVVVGSINRDTKPTVMDHHDTVVFDGNRMPALNTVRVGDDGTVQATDDALEAVRAAAIRAVNRKRDTVQDGGCITALGVMQSDEKSRQLLLGAVVGAQIALSQGQSVTQGWTMADNVTVEHTAMQLIAAGVAMAQHIARAHFAAVGLKAVISEAQTAEAIQAIDIEAAPWIA